MKITIAKTAGFCMGVRRAVEVALDEANSSNTPIYTYGPLIHNPQVLELLDEKGVPVLDSIPEKGTGTVLIRAHGVPPEAITALETAGFRTVDATCPRVIKVQRIIRRYARKGYHSVIIGDDDHPEVIGLNGYAEGRGHVVNSLDALNQLPAFDNAIIVAQTTQNMLFYDDVKQWAQNNHPDYLVFDTICGSTEKRQAEIRRISGESDVVIVVGGKNSGNTQRLAELAAESGKPSFHIEEESELDLNALKNAETITITAGASTPNWIINRVYKYLESELVVHGNPATKKLFGYQQILLRTNLYLAFGAGSLSYACSKLQGISNSLYPALIAMMYVLSMHIFNHLTAIRSDVFNDPERADFYYRNKRYLAALAVAVGAIGLMCVYRMGAFPFIILLIMSILGLSYNLKVIPRSLFKENYEKLSDIPGSKTVLIAVAWGIVTAILPAISTPWQFSLATVPAFLLATGMVFARTVFFDILEMQGDRIVGQKTIPLLLGDTKTIRLLKQILVGLFFILPLSSALHLISGLGYFLCLFPMIMFAVLYAYEKGRMLYGFRLEFIIETHLILAGVIAMIWSFF